METEQIKQMAEANALLKYPVNTNWSSHNGTIDFNESKREAYAQAIIDTYIEPERVNEKLLRQVQRLTTWLRMEGNDDDVKMILEAEEVMNEAEAIQSASQQQENNDGWINVETPPLLYKEVSGYCKNSGFCEIDEEGNFTDKEGYFIGITHYKPLPNTPKEK